MAGAQTSLARRGGVVVYELTPHIRFTLAPLTEGAHGFDALHRKGKMARRALERLVDDLVAHGTLCRTEQGELAFTPLGRFDYCADGPKAALLAFADRDTLCEDAAPGSGRHPASLRALGDLARRAPGGQWTLTFAGREVRAAALAAARSAEGVVR